MPMNLSLLLQMLEQNDDKHDEAHKRLRRDLTDGLNAVNDDLDRVERMQQADHETIVRQQAMRERRKEMSGYRAVIVAAAIGGGFRLIEVLITQATLLLK